MKRVLIIEDEPPILKVLSDQLTKEGVSVATAVDGAAGLELALKTHPDIILLDLILPVMHGLECLRKLRQDPWGRDVPVVVLSNLSDKRRIAEAEDLGVKEYLLKATIDPATVSRKIMEHLAVLERQGKLPASA
ncbi:MAG: response regulator [Patescibacteria group bacterium]|nr:response regulator [Patescibacteria group bacterium]MDE2172950.1 response regulator [Patescibacteria group bacterium]